MSAANHSVSPESEVSIYGKLFGILDDRHELKDLSDALAKLEITEVEFIEGKPGALLLEKWEHTVSGFLMGDMEPKMMGRYLTAVRQGLTIFTVAVKGGRAEEIAGVAKQFNATHVVYFGESVVTSF